MELTLKNIRKIKDETDNALTRKVCNYLISHWSDYDSKKNLFTDILTYGCQSGTVSELIYYCDTLAFYKRYRNEINELLYQFTRDCSCDAAGLFGEKWDTEDPLAIEDHNQNLLAWFGFEEALRNIGMNFKCLQNYI